MTSEKNNAHTINILHFIYYFVTKCNPIVNQLLKNAFMDQAEVLKIGEISLGTSKDIYSGVMSCIIHLEQLCVRKNMYGLN